MRLLICRAFDFERLYDPDEPGRMADHTVTINVAIVRRMTPREWRGQPATKFELSDMQADTVAEAYTDVLAALEFYLPDCEIVDMAAWRTMRAEQAAEAAKCQAAKWAEQEGGRVGAQE